ncbi:MAG: hypothetical protein V4649_12280 [Bacteroidota bacterium]
MSEFFKKALGLFVEFEDDTDAAKVKMQGPPTLSNKTPQPANTGPLSQQDVDKFTRHFNDLFDRANLPGPDYYEFSRMMHLLEAQIPDENIRIATVFASLSIQGLTKDKIIETARQYCTMVEADRAQFERAASEKANIDIEGRKSKVAVMERKIAENSELIKKLTQEIVETQAQIGTLRNEIQQEDARIAANKSSFTVAYQAMYNKINSDIQKINTILK